MFKITLPSGLTGERYGLDFVGGVAKTDNATLAEKLRRKGIPVEPPEAESQEVPETPGQESGTEGQAPPTDPDPEVDPEEVRAPLPEPSPEPEEQPASENPELAGKLAALDKMTVPQLRSYAAAAGIDISGIAAKVNILAKIKAAESGG